MMADNWIMGADIGGTHITAGWVDLQTRTVVQGSLVRQAVNAAAPAAEVISTWCGAIEKAAGGKAIGQLSLAMPGPFDYEQGISLMKGQGKYSHLYGVNVKEGLAAVLQVKLAGISMLNDAAAFLQGEVFAGAARGAEKALGLTLGTGLGSAVYRPPVAEDAGLWCSPFRDGIAEDYLCTRWFVRRMKELTGARLQDVLDLVSGPYPPDAVQQLFREFGSHLAELLGCFVADHHPEVVVIGGNIARSFHHFEASLLPPLQRSYPNLMLKTAQLGEEAALLGAVSFREACHRAGICS